MKGLLRAFFRLTLLPLTRLIYRLRMLNPERVPTTGGVLLLSNHLSFIDAFILTAACPRPVRFVIVSRYLEKRAISWFLELFGAIPITPGKSRDAIRVTAQRLKEGDFVCLFPEGQLSRTGMLNELKKGFELIARQSGADVQCVWMQGLWGSVFTFERGQYFHKWPHRLPWPVTVAFGEPVSAKEATVDWARESLLGLSAEALGALPMANTSLAEGVVRGLKRRPGSVCFAEYAGSGKAPRRLQRHHVLATAAGLAERWRAALPIQERRVGVLLPSGPTPAMINLGIVFAGRVPVNLPFPASAEGQLDPAEVSAAIREAGVSTVITSRAFLGVLEKVEWPDPDKPGNFIDMAGELGAISLLTRLRERLLIRIEPTWLTMKRLELRRDPIDGEPSWACIDENGDFREFDDRAVLAQTLRLGSGNWLEAGEAIFTEEGLASVAGAQWSLWLPVLRRHCAVSRSFGARTDVDLIEDACLGENVRRLILKPGTAETIAELEEPWHPELRSILRSALILETRISEPGTRKNGDKAEPISVFRVPPSAFERVTGALPCPTWQPTELGVGVLAVSQDDPNPEALKHIHQPQHGRKDGSLGRLLPGIVFREIPDGEGLQIYGPGLENGKKWIDLPTRTRIDEEGFVFPP
ncbi:MAG: 1-acyl-sn-glycerol-3-phosphate acyltransferase [Verrucomicrobiae bacterium]|nr:1-acyl-sn-glycerol-3-phosphate acyltransferase [Verrucomicrobiae bacterium]